jgi:hypothetical protein
MKLIRLIFLLGVAVFFLAFFSTCKKSNNDTWTTEEKASYDNVIALQDQAAANYNAWMQTMDSLEVITALQQFFLSDPSVISATIGSQGIAVEYTNGMGGGIFLNPQDNPGDDSLNLKSFKKDHLADIKSQPIVNIKEAILLNPHYWDRMSWTDKIIANYNQYLPMAGYILARTYFDDEADVDQFTKLSGYGIIHIYTHGLAWPTSSNIQAVYLLTGEEENEDTSEKYWEELRNKEIIIFKTSTSELRIENVYLISEKFIAGHNDFSQDTILFYGGFCYSALGNWPDLQKSFAAGTYFGFDWAVRSNYCNDWANDLIKTLADTTSGQPGSVVNWLGSPLDKSYLDLELERVVSIDGFGDDLFLWKKPIYIGQSYGGGLIFYIDATKQHGLICAPTDYQPYWPYLGWGGFGTEVGTSTAIGKGQYNTTRIVSAIGSGGAAGVCDDLVLNGYSDWFLPSKDELNEMFKQRTIVGANAYYYWSSSEWEDDPAYAVWRQNFSLAPFGDQAPDYKTYDYSATRAVRAF